MKQIIIVEDDASIKEIMTIILTKAGYSITSFSYAAPILDNNFRPPDAFILDKQLPDADGLDLCYFLKTQTATKNIPVIMVSANPNIIALANKALADDALEKPFKRKDLVDMVTKHVGV